MYLKIARRCAQKILVFRPALLGVEDLASRRSDKRYHPLTDFGYGPMIKFKCKDFLLKECEFEAKGTRSVNEMMKLVEVHAGDEHRTLRLSPETLEKIRSSLTK
jgi:predicted small metal-binding protein